MMRFTIGHGGDLIRTEMAPWSGAASRRMMDGPEIWGKMVSTRSRPIAMASNSFLLLVASCY